MLYFINANHSHLTSSRLQNGRLPQQPQFEIQKKFENKSNFCVFNWKIRGNMILLRKTYILFMVMWSFPLYDFLKMVKNMEMHSVGLHVWKDIEEKHPFL